MTSVLAPAGRVNVRHVDTADVGAGDVVDGAVFGGPVGRRHGVADVAAVAQLGVDDRGERRRAPAASAVGTSPAEETDVVTNSVPIAGQAADAGEVDVAGEHDELAGDGAAAASSRSRAGA